MNDHSNGQQPLLLEKAIRINGYDIDVLGIVSNIVYVRWFEDLRHHFLDVYWPYEEMLTNRQSPVLAKTEVEYKHPLTIHDKPMGKIWVEHFGRGKWIMSFEITNGDKVICTGRQTGYVIDTERMKPIPIPDGLRQKYEAARKA